MATLSSQNRTTVRADARIKLATTRAALTVLHRIAPSAGAAMAARLWCTLPGSASRRRDERPYAGERSTLELSHGRSLAVESWGIGMPVYLLHGWGGWRGQLGAFIAPLVDAGYRVVGIDAPSHGESAPGVLGRGRSIGPELSDALAAAADEHGKPAAVIAHSFGATATAVAVGDGLPADRLVLIAPPIGLDSALRSFNRTFNIGERLRAAMIERLESAAGRSLSDYDLTELARNAALPPALVVHDRTDKEVPYDDSTRLAAEWPNAELATTDGLGHQRILRTESVTELVVDYLTR